MKDRRILFRVEKEIKAIKYRVLRDIKNLFDNEEEIYKAVRANISLF